MKIPKKYLKSLFCHSIMSYCENCGEKREVDSTFCHSCGYKYEVPTTQAVPTPNTFLISSATHPVRKRKQNTKDIISGIICIAVIGTLFIIGAFFYAIFEDIIDFIISIVFLIIILGCFFRIFLGLIEEVRDRSKKKKLQNQTK
ncbi:MAG: hypothetical protein ACTSR8_03380 [Promethearchaeota archaeon]